MISLAVSFQPSTYVMAEYISALEVQYIKPRHGYVRSSKYWNKKVNVTKLPIPVVRLGRKASKRGLRSGNKQKRTIPPSQREHRVIQRYPRRVTRNNMSVIYIQVVTFPRVSHQRQLEALFQQNTYNGRIRQYVMSCLVALYSDRLLEP